MAYKNYADQLAANKRHYWANTEYYKKKATYWRKQKRLIMEAYKAKTPCTDCKNTFPAECMDFDHVRGIKAFIISRGCDFSAKKLQAEMAKCDLVCANCHRTRTRKRIRRSIDRTFDYESKNERAIRSGSTKNN